MATKQIRGFRIRLKLVKAIKSVFQERQPHSMTRLGMFGRRLKRTLKDIWFYKSGLRYARIGHESFDEKTRVPKGHLAVYIGEEEDDIRRVLVPVIYFNHPLFGDLLREAEEVYGHDHCGGIHVPCRLSEFEDVQTRICAAGGCGRSRL